MIASNISPDIIPWSGITAVGIRKIKLLPILEIKISPQVLRTIRLSKRNFFFGRINKIFGFSHFYIATYTLGYGAEHIRDLLQARIVQASAGAETGSQQ